MTSRALASVVLAAGEGKRMRSARPKPLHLLCGRAMLLHILDAVAEMGADRAVVVVGHGAERITKKLVDDGPPDLPIEFVEQAVQRGTGDAVMVGDSGIDVEAAHNAGLPAVIVLNGYMRSSEEAAKAAVTIASLEECPAAVGAIWMFGRERLPQLARPQRPTRD